MGETRMEPKGTGMDSGSSSGDGETREKGISPPAKYQGGTKMDLLTAATDNITEVLQKILEFTSNRQKILIENITSMNRTDFEPRDLPVKEFAGLMILAVSEHINSRRLLLCDGENVKFGPGGSFETTPIIDKKAKRLLAKSRKRYMRDQASKLLENALNQRIATRILRQKQAGELVRIKS